MPSASAERAIEPRFSASLSASSTASRRGAAGSGPASSASRSAGGGGGRRGGGARTPVRRGEDAAGEAEADHLRQQPLVGLVRRDVLRQVEGRDAPRDAEH